MVINTINESIELPNSIATIPAGAFYGCDKLKEVKLPSNVKQLGAASFLTVFRAL